MECVQPCPCHVTQLVGHSTAQLLGQGQDWRLGAGVQKKCQEGTGLARSIVLDEGKEVGITCQEFSPVCGGSCDRSSQARALASRQVLQCARQVTSAARNSAHARFADTEVTTKPAGSVPARDHTRLHRGLPDLVRQAVAGRPEGGGAGQ